MAFLIGGFQLVLCVLAVANAVFSGVSAEAKAINKDLALVPTWGFLLTGAPALFLAYLGRWLWMALLLALAPFIALVGLLAAVAIG